MDRFSKLHPMMQFLFFITTFVVVLTINNPIFSAISLISCVVYNFVLFGKRTFKTLKFTLVIIIFVSLFNMLFAHYGVTTLFTVKETTFTLEALFYGFNQSMVLSSVIIWFSIFSKTVDSEKIIYLFRFAPKLALLFSIVLGFIPRFTTKLDEIQDARMGLNGGKKPKNKLKFAIENLSALVTYSLESSIITADSMEARQYNPKSIRPSRYKFQNTDVVLIVVIIALFGFVLSQILMKNTVFVFDPQIYIKRLSIPAVICFVVLEFIPVAVDLVEEILWKLSVSKN